MSLSEPETDTIPSLVTCDNKGKSIWTLPVDQKGVDEKAVTWIIERPEAAGYAGGKVVLK